MILGQRLLSASRISPWEQSGSLLATVPTSERNIIYRTGKLAQFCKYQLRRISWYFISTAVRVNQFFSFIKSLVQSGCCTGQSRSAAGNKRVKQVMTDLMQTERLLEKGLPGVKERLQKRSLGLLRVRYQ